jgi:uncharacterized protein (TIGR02996 family)
MQEEKPFLNAIKERPDDNAIRLVYADWLEERGDPRGEFIRVAVEIAKAAPHTDRYAALRVRLKTLRECVNSDWATALGYQPRHRPLFGVLPDRRSDRWRLVEEFIEVWHRPLQPGDGFSEAELQAAEGRLGCRLPAAIREWYALAGRRADVWSLQDDLESLDRLRVEPGTDILVIRRENQNCERWGIRVADLAGDDPPVVEVNSEIQSSPTTSAFACLVLVYEAIFARRVRWASVEFRVGEDEVRAMTVRGLSPCNLPDRYWAASPIRVFEGTDLIVQCHGEDFVYVAVRGEQGLEQLDSEVRRRLEFYT